MNYSPAPSRAEPRRENALATFLARHPLAGAILLVGAMEALIVLGALGLEWLAPGLSKQTLQLILLPILVLFDFLLLTVLGWWRVVGFNRPSRWRSVGLLLIPAALFLVPLVGGIRPIDPGTLAFLVVAYALTALNEETFDRGLVLRALRPMGPVRAVLISGLLFGLTHLSNLLFRDNAALVLWQVVGAATSGVGLAALRLRTKTLWPLIGLHFMEDLFLQLGYLPIPVVNAAQSVVMLLLGLWLLRNPAALGESATPNPGESEPPVLFRPP